MRLPSFPTIINSFYTISSTARRFLPRTQRALQPFGRPEVLRSIQVMPFGLFRSNSKNMDFPVQKSEEEWQAQLSPQQFAVIRQKGTETPFTGKYDKHMATEGVYSCTACNAPLYKATHKFSSGCGWPAFFDAIPGAVTRHTDGSFGMKRTEIVCSNCGGHLGHVFKGEGYRNPTNERHCVNSVSLNFSEDDLVTTTKRASNAGN